MNEGTRTLRTAAPLAALLAFAPATLWAPNLLLKDYPAGLKLARSSQWMFAGWDGGGCYPVVEFDPNRPGRVYLTSDVAGVWKSEDLGEGWTFITRGLENTSVATIAEAPSDPGVLYAGTNGGMFVTRDDGASWRACDRLNGEMSFVRPQNHRSIAVSHIADDRVAAGTASGSVVYSVDGGGAWKVLGGKKNPFDAPGRNPITALAFSPDDRTLYAGSGLGISRYSFDADRWTLLAGGPREVDDLLVSRRGPGVVYAACGNRLWISEDGGDSWSRSSSVPSGTITRVAESSDGSEIAAVWEKGWNGGVLISGDRGATWRSADGDMACDTQRDPTRTWSRPGRTIDVKIDPFDKNVLFRTDWWGVWRSDDGGRSWREKIAGLPNTVGSDLFLDGDDRVYVAAMDDGLLRSANGGRSYEALFPTRGNDDDTNGHVWRVIVSPDNGTIVATSSPWNRDLNQVVVSNNGGKSFFLVRHGLPGARPKSDTMWGQGYPRGLAADPKDFNTLYLGIDGDDGGGLFVSHDRGRTWRRSPGQPGSLRIYNGLAVDPTDPDRIFWGACGDQGGVWRSTDRGANWSRVLSDPSWVFDLTVGQNGTVYAAGDSGGPVIWASWNHGDSWKELRHFPGKGACDAVCIDPKDPSRVAVSTHLWDHWSGGKIWLSRDGGTHWTDITGDLPPGSGAAAMAFGKKTPFLYISRYAGSVYKRRI